MTNELEKQFFDAFGIEPKYEAHSCDGWGRTVEVKYFTDKKEADKFGIVVSELEYPQITDRILLELIRLGLNYDFVIHSKSVEELKEKLLALLIYNEAEFKQRVQELFKECE